MARYIQRVLRFKDAARRLANYPVAWIHARPMFDIAHVQFSLIDKAVLVIATWPPHTVS